jgi:methionine synthase II (cobalamin-independent)
MAGSKRNPPFRAEHLGPLLRPKEFLAKRAAFENNQLSQADLTAAEDESITKVVKVQTDIGFRAVTDGEYRCVRITSVYPTRAIIPSRSYRIKLMC